MNKSKDELRKRLAGAAVPEPAPIGELIDGLRDAKPQGYVYIEDRRKGSK